MSISGSFYEHRRALDLLSRYDSLRNPLTSPGDFLKLELISRRLAESGVVSAGYQWMMIWCIVSMARSIKSRFIRGLTGWTSCYRATVPLLHPARGK